MAGQNRVFLGPTPEFPSIMTDKLSYMRQNGVLTDFTITVQADEPKLRCHKVVLAIHSPVFEGMFVSGMVETETNSVYYDDISVVTMTLILDYCYHEQIDFPDDQLIPIIIASDFFQMDRLKMRCMNEVKTFLTPENVLQYLTFAVQHTLKEVKLWCMEIIIKSFPEVAKQAAFRALSYAEIMECLTEAVKSDVPRDDILRAVFQWFSDDAAERDTYLEELLQKVQLDLCSLSAISTAMKTHKAMIASNVNVLSLLAESMTQIVTQLQKSSEAVDTESAEKLKKVEKPAESEKQLVIVGGQVYNGNVSPQCWRFDSKQNKFIKWCTIPYRELVVRHSVCKTPSGFAVSGGENSNLCAVFVASSKEWKRMPKMMRTRWRHGSVCIQGKLYVLCGTVSGSNSASVDCLTLENGKWVSLPDCPIQTTLPKVAEINGLLYLLSTSELVKLDVEKNVWINLAAAPSAFCAYESMIAVNDQLCVAGGSNKNCAWYHPSTNMWSVGQQKPSKHFYGSLVQQDNTTLLLLGGYYRDGTDEVEEYNITDGSWSVSTFQMPARLWSHTALYLDIPQG